MSNVVSKVIYYSINTWRNIVLKLHERCGTQEKQKIKLLGHKEFVNSMKT